MKYLIPILLFLSSLCYGDSKTDTILVPKKTGGAVGLLNNSGPVTISSGATDGTSGVTITSGSTSGQTLLKGSSVKMQTYSSGWQDRLTILNDGKVGVGTSSPGAKLEISGGMTYTYQQAGSFAGERASFGYLGTVTSPTQVTTGSGLFGSTYLYGGGSYRAQGYVGWEAEQDITAANQSGFVIANGTGAKRLVIDKDGIVKITNQIKVDTINENTSTNGVQIKGRTSGTAISPGYIGENLSFSKTATVSGSQTDYNIGTVYSLPAGKYLFVGNVMIQGGGGTSLTLIDGYISGTGVTLIHHFNNRYSFSGTTNANVGSIIAIINISSAQNIQAKATVTQSTAIDITITGEFIRIG